jgi:uncharacterized protein
MTLPSGLEAWFREADGVLLGYSGGVDSAVLAVAGARVLDPGRFLAVLGWSASVPEAQRRAARSLADQFSVPLLEVDTGELADPSYRSNTVERCFFCKTELWTKLTAVAAARGLPVIVDGSHLDDQADHRPGARAGRESRVRSPFVELGWTKAQVRSVARGLGLPNWSAPASPCLASRIQYGLEVTASRLAQVELAEAYLRTLGVHGDLRVRHHGALARVEVGPDMFEVIDGNWEAIRQRFVEIGFERVERDLRGYRRGSLLPVTP